jgi:hypothetical protein
MPAAYHGGQQEMHRTSIDRESIDAREYHSRVGTMGAGNAGLLLAQHPFFPRDPTQRAQLYAFAAALLVSTPV